MCETVLIHINYNYIHETFTGNKQPAVQSLDDTFTHRIVTSLVVFSSQTIIISVSGFTSPWFSSVLHIKGHWQVLVGAGGTLAVEIVGEHSGMVILSGNNNIGSVHNSRILLTLLLTFHNVNWLIMFLLLIIFTDNIYILIQLKKKLHGHLDHYHPICGKSVPT